MKKNVSLVILGCLLAGCARAQLPATTAGVSQSAVAAAATTATLPSADDAAISEKLRQSILADPGMSVNARNIIIRTDSGVISLRGAVDGLDEERRILEKTAMLMGIKGVDDQLNTHACAANTADFK